MITGVLSRGNDFVQNNQWEKYTVPLIILYIVELILKAFDVMHDGL